jgi:hypothetical protein
MTSEQMTKTDSAASPRRGKASGLDTSAAPALPFEKYFTLSASVQQRPVGEIEGGYRVDFDYGNPTGTSAITGISSTPVLTKRLLPATADDKAVGRGTAGEDLANAQIKSGGDWVFVSDEGFVDFDTKITVELRNVRTSCLLGLRFVGRADLRDSRRKDNSAIFTGDEGADQVIARWKGFDEGTYIPLVLGVTIDVPVSGTNDQQTKIYEEVRVVGHSLLLGIGKIVFGKDNKVVNVTLDVGKATPPHHAHV